MSNPAQPLDAADEVTGAAWLMERLPGIEGGQSRQLLFGSIGFGIAALMTALLAVFVTTEIRSGVNIVLQRLGSMEGGLPAATQQMAGRPPLEEFDRVLHGIDSLALALQEKIENERTLESQVRHNERLSALGQFAAGIAHELRNPLGTIRMRTQMWQRSTDPGSGQAEQRGDPRRDRPSRHDHQPSPLLCQTHSASTSSRLAG